MAIEPILFASALDMDKHQIKNAVLDNLSSQPASLVEGLYYYNTTSKTLCYWNGTKIVEVGDGFTLEPATATTLGGVKVPVAGHITVNADGEISIVDASTSNKGVIQIATDGEVTTGTDNTKAVTPATLKQQTDLYIPLTQKGAASGVAELGADGKVPTAQLPSYVDDVIEAYTRSGATAFSADWLSLTDGGEALTPETGKIYVILSEGDYKNKTVRWGGSTYVLISEFPDVDGTTVVYDSNKKIHTNIDNDTLIYTSTTEETLVSNECVVSPIIDCSLSDATYNPQHDGFTYSGQWFNIWVRANGASSHSDKTIIDTTKSAWCSWGTAGAQCVIANNTPVYVQINTTTGLPQNVSLTYEDFKTNPNGVIQQIGVVGDDIFQYTNPVTSETITILTGASSLNWFGKCFVGEAWAQGSDADLAIGGTSCMTNNSGSPKYTGSGNGFAVKTTQMTTDSGIEVNTQSLDYADSTNSRSGIVSPTGGNVEVISGSIYVKENGLLPNVINDSYRKTDSALDLGYDNHIAMASCVTSTFNDFYSSAKTMTNKSMHYATIYSNNKASNYLDKTDDSNMTAGESVTVAGTTLIAGTDFTVGADWSETASNIATAINTKCTDWTASVGMRSRDGINLEAKNYGAAYNDLECSSSNATLAWDTSVTTGGSTASVTYDNNFTDLTPNAVHSSRMALGQSESKADASFASKLYVDESITQSSAKTDNVTIGYNVSAELEVKDNGLTASKVNDDSITLGASETKANARLISKIATDEAIVAERSATATLTNHTINYANIVSATKASNYFDNPTGANLVAGDTITLLGSTWTAGTTFAVGSTWDETLDNIIALFNSGVWTFTASKGIRTFYGLQLTAKEAGSAYNGLECACSNTAFAWDSATTQGGTEGSISYDNTVTNLTPNAVADERMQLGSTEGKASASFASKQYVDEQVAGADIPDASTTVKGKVMLATLAEITAGTDDAKATTPKTVHDYVTNELVGGVRYRGKWTTEATTTDYSALNSFRPMKQGDLFYVEGTGCTIDGVEYKQGDHIIFNKACSASTTIITSMIDKFDHTESTDLVRLDATQTLTNKTINANNIVLAAYSSNTYTFTGDLANGDSITFDGMTVTAGTDFEVVAGDIDGTMININTAFAGKAEWATCGFDMYIRGGQGYFDMVALNTGSSYNGKACSTTATNGSWTYTETQGGADASRTVVNTISNLDGGNIASSSIAKLSTETAESVQLTSAQYVANLITKNKTKVDDVTIEYSSNKLQVKDNGLTIDKVADGSLVIATGETKANGKLMTQEAINAAVETAITTERSATATLTNKTLDLDNNTLSNIEVDNFKSGIVVDSTTGIAEPTSASDTKMVTEKAVASYVDGIAVKLVEETNPALTITAHEWSWEVTSCGNAISVMVFKNDTGEVFFPKIVIGSTSVTISGTDTSTETGTIAADTYKVRILK